jgi:hypothetical protein
MAKLTIPSANVALGKGKCTHCNSEYEVKIETSWFQKMTEWLKKTNQDSLSTNGKLTVTATSDTNLRFSYVGSDGTTRTADLTLS